MHLRARVERLIAPQWRGTLIELGHVHAALGDQGAQLLVAAQRSAEERMHVQAKLAL